jgi:hypothetical protein
MAKSPGFWFFTGDWMKDPELRFCSIFARGLLVDLLCILFEAKEQGYASNPDGTPRSNDQIVDAIAGGGREEKLAALAELERSGVLSRDIRGVLYSRRLSRLREVSEQRKQSGSKGGSKTQAKLKQTVEQTDKQKRGVSDSVSASDSFKEITHTHEGAGEEFRKPGWAASEWDRWVAEWNQTERAEPWKHLTPPHNWVDLAGAPGWLDRAREALAMLPSRRYFNRPLAMTKFFEFIDRIRAGEFSEPAEPRGSRMVATAGGSKPARRGNL